MEKNFFFCIYMPSSTKVYCLIFLIGHHIDLKNNYDNDIFTLNHVNLSFKRIVVSHSLLALRYMGARIAIYKTDSLFLKIIGFGFEYIGIVTVELII